MNLLRLAFLVLLAAGTLALRTQDPHPIRFSAGAHEYEWVPGWGALAEGKILGNTHGCVVVDKQDRIYLCTDTKDAVVVFDPSGRVLSTFGKELAGGLHGLALVEEDGRQFFLMAHLGRHQVLKTTLEGEILWTLDYPAESGLYRAREQYRPTSVVPLPGGGFLVADGYGKSWIHRYDEERKYVKSFGGPGTELGKLHTPHGLWVDTRGPEPRLLVADRENNRIQIFDLEGVPMGEIHDVERDLLRRPCHMHPFGDELVVADLAGRVTLLDRAFGLIAHLGDNPDPGKRARNDVQPSEWRDGEFLAPHCANWDSQGNLYVTDWVSRGRITKLARVK